MASQAEKDFYSFSNFYDYFACKEFPTGFTSGSSADDVATHYKDEIKGKVIIVTGANSGVGRESARVFYKYGAHVIIACRTESKATEAMESFKKLYPESEGKLTFLSLDMSNLASVKKFCEEFLALNLELNILLANAGAVLAQEEESADGIEGNFATNHMGNYYMIELLTQKLRETKNSRIVILSSGAQFTRWGAPDKELPEYDEFIKAKKFDSGQRYALAKLCNMMHARELAERFKEQGDDIVVYGIHPGFVRSNFGSSFGSVTSTIFGMNFLGKNTNQGASSQVFACLATEIRDKTGGFISDNNFYSPNPIVEDPAQRKKLIEISDRALKEKFLEKN